MEVRGIEQGAVEAGGDQRPCRPCRRQRRDGRDAGSQPARSAYCARTRRLRLPRFRTAGSAAAARRSAGLPAPCSRDRARTAPPRPPSPSGRAMLARRPATIRIISAKMTGQAATSSLRKIRECTATPPENANASVASIATRQSRTMQRTRPAKISTQPVAIRKARSRPARTALVMAASKAATLAADGIADSDQASSRPRRVQQLEPEFHRQDGDVGGVIEEQLRLAVVEGKRVVDHHEIHVGVAPVDQRIAEQKKRCRKAGDDRRQSPSPAEESQPVEGVLRRDRSAARSSRPGWKTGSCRRSFSPAAGAKRPAAGRAVAETSV